MGALNSISPLLEDEFQESEWSSTWLPRQAAETCFSVSELWPGREYPSHEPYKLDMVRA